MQAYSASLRGKFASQTLPPPYGVTLYAVHTRGGLLFHQQTESPSVATFLPSANRTTNLTAFPWQLVFIPAQGSSNTIKTVGGEAVRRFFSLKYAVLLY